MNFAKTISSFLIMIALSHLALASGSTANSRWQESHEIHFDFGDHHYRYIIDDVTLNGPYDILSGCLEYYDSTGVIEVGCDFDVHWFQNGNSTELDGAGTLYFSCYTIDFDTFGSKPKLFDCDGNELEEGEGWSYQPPQQ